MEISVLRMFTDVGREKGEVRDLASQWRRFGFTVEGEEVGRVEAREDDGVDAWRGNVGSNHPLSENEPIGSCHALLHTTTSLFWLDMDQYVN